MKYLDKALDVMLGIIVLAFTVGTIHLSIEASPGFSRIVEITRAITKEMPPSYIMKFFGVPGWFVYMPFIVSGIIVLVWFRDIQRFTNKEDAE